VSFQVPGTPSETAERVGPVMAAVQELQRGHPGYVVEELGGASANRELDATIGKDLRRAEQLSLPVTLLILVVAFGALVAASIPALLGFTAVLATYGLAALFSHLLPTIDTSSMTVVLVAVIGSLTVLPALLSKLGHRVERGGIPFLGRGRHSRAGAGVWARVLTPVLRRPLVSAVSATLLLVLLALPATGLKTKSMSLADLPKSLPVARTYQRIQAAFPGSSVPAVVAVQASDVTAPQVTSAIADLHRRAIASGRMSEPVSVQVNPARTVALVDIPLKGNDNDRRALDALRTLRGELIPATVGRLPGARVGVTGDTAGSKDFNDLMRERAPLVFAFVLGLAFLLLLVTFRSIVIPIKSILLNLLSVAASYGVLVAIFQYGWGVRLLGAEASGGITAWLPLFLFVVLFGLSMDYHVFILSRVKELADRGEPTSRAVERGIKATAGTVTSAAVVMVAVFAVFASLSMVDVKQAGVGLAIAVLLDATIIRGVLLPATMALLGDWNWYLPRWLRWLPRHPSVELPLEPWQTEVVDAVPASAP
jgi:uncharacterized membrane protein YdfJ with MMPL/SSD domain